MGQRIDCTAKFKRPGSLEIFTFEKQLMTGHLIERLAGEDGRAMSMAGDVPGCALDVRKYQGWGGLMKVDCGHQN
jgi:hypothetical protein